MSAGIELPDRSDSNRALFRDLFVDLMGSLVPGIAFSVLGFSTLLATLFLLWQISMVWSGIHGAPPEFRPFVTIVQTFRWEIPIFFLLSSYILGSLAYRADPKHPDSASASYIWCHGTEEERRNYAVQPANSSWNDFLRKFSQILMDHGKGPKTSASNAVVRSIVDRYESLVRLIALRVRGSQTLDVQFPYLYLSEYLTGRGLNHLAQYIPWKGKDPATYCHRTKMFINILKIRLNLEAPEKTGEIIKAEAHIRLMSSVWFAAGALEKIALFCAGSLLFCAQYTDAVTQLSSAYTLLLFWCLFILVLAAYTRRSIKKFFHYQRVREAVYVIETAHWIVCTKKIPLFQDLQSVTGRAA